MYKNYNSIELFPENFTQYLLSPEVGFAKSEILGFPQHHSKGFQRPIHVYTKSTILSSERVECLQTNYAKNVYLPTESPQETNGIINRAEVNEEKCDDNGNCQTEKLTNEKNCDDTKLYEAQQSVDDNKKLAVDNT